MSIAMGTAGRGIVDVQLAIRHDRFHLACDYHFYQWSESDSRDKQTGEEYESTWQDSKQVHVGVEYLAPLFEGYPTPIRLGFYTYPRAMPTQLQQIEMDELAWSASSTAERIAIYKNFDQKSRNFYCLGLGLITADAVLDFAAEISPFTDEYDFSDGGTSDGPKVENKEMVMKFYLSGIYKFGAGI